MMKRALAAATAFLLIGSLSGAALGESGAGPETAEVEAALAALGSGEMITVSVTLWQQANLGAVRRLEASERAAGTAGVLKATAAATQGPLRALLAGLQAGGEVADFEMFWIVNGASVTGTAAAVSAIAQLSSVKSIDIEPDIELVGSYSPAATEANLDLVNAPDAWAAGLTGEGVVVATLDTGVYLHQDVVGSYRGGTNSWFDPYGQHPQPFDADGHGTGTMSVIVGRDNGGTAIGVAPDAQWISAKIFDDSGHATATAIHQAFQWILDPDGDPTTDDAPQVVSNSWTVSSAGCDTTFEPDLIALRAADILPIFAAGNAGPGPNTSRSPGNLPEAFSVGAVDNNDAVYFGSSRGPSSCGGDAQFPDIVAPGVGIKAADHFPGTYWNLTGTSLAAPHVAGALALLFEQRGDLLVEQQEDLLLQGVVDLGTAGPDTTYGAGRLDIAASMAVGTTNADPVADFSVKKAKKGFWNFDASASFDPDGTIVSYQWDFGDGTNASGMKVSHKYSTADTFTVVLVVTDDKGASATTSAVVSTVKTKGGGNGGRRPR